MRHSVLALLGHANVSTAINGLELSVINGELIPGDLPQPAYVGLKPGREER